MNYRPMDEHYPRILFPCNLFSNRVLIIAISVQIIVYLYIMIDNKLLKMYFACGSLFCIQYTVYIAVKMFTESRNI